MSAKAILHDQKHLENLQFFSVAEVAIILGTSRRSVHTWIREGLLPAFRLGPKTRVVRIHKGDLDTFIASHKSQITVGAGTFAEPKH